MRPRKFRIFFGGIFVGQDLIYFKSDAYSTLMARWGGAPEHVCSEGTAKQSSLELSQKFCKAHKAQPGHLSLDFASDAPTQIP